jgi:hypothetical protein
MNAEKGIEIEQKEELWEDSYLIASLSIRSGLYYSAHLVASPSALPSSVISHRKAR